MFLKVESSSTFSNARIRHGLWEGTEGKKSKYLRQYSSHSTSDRILCVHPSHSRSSSIFKPQVTRYKYAGFSIRLEVFYTHFTSIYISNIENPPISTLQLGDLMVSSNKTTKLRHTQAVFWRPKVLLNDLNSQDLHYLILGVSRT